MIKEHIKYYAILLAFLCIIFFPTNSVSIKPVVDFKEVKEEDVATVEKKIKETNSTEEKENDEVVTSTPIPTQKPVESTYSVPAATPNPSLIQMNSYLSEILILPTSYDVNEVNAIIGRLHLYGNGMLKKLAENGTRIILASGPITDTPELSYLKGVVPRGYTNGQTWDSVPGATSTSSSNKYSVIRIGYSFKGNGSIVLELHEVSHLIDMFVFNKISSSSEFTAIKNKEKSNLFASSYFDYSEEYFAECLAMYIYGGNSRNTLRYQAPQTYAFLERLMNS